MGSSQILWVDLRLQRKQPSLYHHLTKKWSVYRTCESGKIINEIQKIAPVLLCFEYDYPDRHSLSILQKTLQLLPSTPIIMLTEQHSEALAVWALRNRVWDYLVKPLSHQELLMSAESSLSLSRTGHAGRQNSQVPNPIPAELRFNIQQRKMTLPAQSFVEKHCHEKIAEKDVAQLCGMNTSTFSRAFKKEHGITFRDYLINYRIHRAQELLQNPNITVKDIAYTVGFHDPSYFTRMFRRIVGISPSRYHDKHLKQQPEESSISS